MKEYTLKYSGRLGLFTLCGSIYALVEILYRGWSHESMFILAGLLGVFCIDIPNNIYSFDLDLRWQILSSTVLCTLGEGICGLIVNKWLGLAVWDYSNLPGTFFWKQCNVMFVAAWLILVAIAIPICDAYNYYACGIEPCPYYRIGNRYFYMEEKR